MPTHTSGSAHLHEKDVVELRCGDHLLDLLKIHSQRLLAQDTLLGVHEAHTHFQMAGMYGTHIYHVCPRQREDLSESDSCG